MCFAVFVVALPFDSTFSIVNLFQTPATVPLMAPHDVCSSTVMTLLNGAQEEVQWWCCERDADNEISITR
jgi:hypothetical protein